MTSDRRKEHKTRLHQYGGIQCNCSIAPDDVPAVYAARVEAAHKREVAELHELLTELAHAADTAFSAISACGKLIGTSDVSDSVYRNRLLERVAKMLKALKGVDK